MKKSELKQIIKEVVCEERQRMCEIESSTKGAIVGFIAGVVLAVLGKRPMPSLSIEDDPEVKQKKQEFEKATLDFAKSLAKYPGETAEEKYKSYQNALSRIKFSKPIPIFPKKKQKKI